MKSRRSPKFVFSVHCQSPMSVVRCLMFDVQRPWSDVQIPMTYVRLPKKSKIRSLLSRLEYRNLLYKRSTRLARGLTKPGLPSPKSSSIRLCYLKLGLSYLSDQLEGKSHARLSLKKQPSS